VPDSSPEELAALLALAEAPEPAIPLGPLKGRAHVQAFLDDLQIRPGRSRGPTVFVLYAIYCSWVTRLVPPQEPVGPTMFTKALRRAGFKRKHRTQRGGKDERYLGVSPDCSERLLRERQYSQVDAEAARKLLDPRTGWAKRQQPQPPELESQS